jgi:hypothetical protein
MESLLDKLNGIVDEIDYDRLFAPSMLDAIRVPTDERQIFDRARASHNLNFERGAARRLLELAYPNELRQLPPKYLHLYDGGVSDNLGWGTLKHAARAYVQSAPPTAPASGCFIIIIDAHAKRPAGSGAFLPDVRHGLTYLLNYSSIDDAVSTLMDEQRDSLLTELQPSDQVFERWPLGLVADEPNVSVTMCDVWRLGFDRILPVLSQHAEGPSTYQGWAEDHADVIAAHRTLQAFVNSVSTDFRFVGPSGCSDRDINKALIDAAHVLLFEDRIALGRARDWMQTHFGDTPSLGKSVSLYADAKPARVLTETPNRNAAEVECR